MYFLQAAGQHLGLNYVKAPYGPYAENLNHVRNKGTNESRIIRARRQTESMLSQLITGFASA